ncbi:Histone deacetylase 11 [Trichinella papuae]|uniref:Histone deacetylase 11 n=1 Tax=Trichinella papuae TaxID=268474 RepID=A0A0V1MLL5_9BILA|nr:Histone deacetylase 11 [Trichinella papuae]
MDITEEDLGRINSSKLYAPLKEQGLHSFVFDPIYDIRFFGIEKLHPFDAGKWGRVYNKLVERGYINEQHICHPREAQYDDLLIVHSKSYLSTLKWNVLIARIMEVPLLIFFPACVIDRKVLKSFRYQTGGTVLAVRLAIECGAAVNLGGGFHHCSSKSGGGFCPYADITLAIKFLFAQRLVEKVMIVDLDAHQGNGHERDFLTSTDNVYILDVYNCDIYPRDAKAKKAIRKPVEIKSQTSDQQYFTLLKKALDEAVLEFQPELVLYNAGTDSLTNDPLGNLDLSPTAILQRDELIFKTFRKSNPAVPIAMVFSGGYQRNSAEVIANSLGNLIDKGYINRLRMALNFTQLLRKYNLPSPFSLAMYGAVGAICGIYITDWNVIIRYIPFYGNKLKEPKHYEDILQNKKRIV